MYSIKSLHRNFIMELSSLEQILEDLSLEPKSFKRDVFIQGAFLRAVINWENFIEECFLAAMCTCKTNSNSVLRPKTTLSKNKNEAFKKISTNRRLRDGDYVDWIDYQKIKQRVDETFHHRSRFHSIYRDATILNQIKAIRNHIAHNSKHSERNFREQIIQNVGYLAIPDPNAADILVSTNRGKALKFFRIYLRYYTDTANDICK